MHHDADGGHSGRIRSFIGDGGGGRGGGVTWHEWSNSGYDRPGVGLYAGYKRANKGGGVLEELRRSANDESRIRDNAEHELDKET